MLPSHSVGPCWHWKLSPEHGRGCLPNVLFVTSSSHLTRSAAWSPSRTARASPPSASPPSPPRAAGGSARSSGSRDTAPADVDTVYTQLYPVCCVSTESLTFKIQILVMMSKSGKNIHSDGNYPAHYYAVLSN